MACHRKKDLVHFRRVHIKNLTTTTKTLLHEPLARHEDCRCADDSSFSLVENCLHFHVLTHVYKYSIISLYTSRQTLTHAMTSLLHRIGELMVPRNHSCPHRIAERKENENNRPTNTNLPLEKFRQFKHRDAAKRTSRTRQAVCLHFFSTCAIFSVRSKNKYMQLKLLA